MASGKVEMFDAVGSDRCLLVVMVPWRGGGGWTGYSQAGRGKSLMHWVKEMCHLVLMERDTGEGLKGGGSSG